MSARCEKRTAPQDPGGTRITPRDLLLLRLIGRCQPISTPQIQAFLSCSPDIARRRARVLRDQRLIRVLLGPSLNETNYYVLAPRAQDLLLRTFGGEDADYPTRRTLPGDLAHHLGVVDAFIAFEVATARLGHVQVAEVLLDGELRAWAAERREQVHVPDLVVVLQGEDEARMAVAAEYDTGSIAPHTVGAKFRLYAEARAQGQLLRGCTIWSVLLLCPSIRRRNRLMMRLAEEPSIPEGFVFFALSPEVEAATLFRAATWRTQRTGGDDVVRWSEESPFSPVISARHFRHDGPDPAGVHQDRAPHATPNNAYPPSARTETR